MKRLLLSFSLLSAFILLFSGCVKNYYYDGFESDSNSSNGGTTEKTYAVRFQANVQHLANTRADQVTPLQQNRFVTLYVFGYHADEICEINYTTNEAGVLTPVKGDGLYLSIGTFELYALSIGNQPSYPPIITNLDLGMIGGLDNGLDYLAYQDEELDITGPTTVNMTFKHAATQVKVLVESGSSSTVIDSISSATISAPTTTSSTIDLYTGVINAATSLSSTPIAMSITDSLCQQILLPLRYSGDLTMNFSAYVNGSASAVAYTVDIPLVNGQLAEGSSYEYEVLVVDEKVTIANASVSPWTDVNETGTPLTPEHE